MSVLVKIYKVPAPEQKEVPIFRLGSYSSFPFDVFTDEEDDFLKDSINLNELVMTQKGMTFYAKVVANYHNTIYKEGDVLVVNRSWALQKDKMVICGVGEEFVLKQIRLSEGKLWLESLNGQEDPVLLTDENYLQVWGVVTHELRRLW